jgi:glyceraldehyde-3-phosphate dehydrogenase (NADP+)
MSSYGNLINNTITLAGVPHRVFSPVTNECIGTIPLATRDDILCALSRLENRPQKDFSPKKVFDFLKRFKEQLLLKKTLFFEKTYLETGFVAEDAREIVDGAIEFLNDFEIYVQDKPFKEQIIRHSYSSLSHRDIRVTQRPFQCVAAVVPQNASLTLSIIIIASALYAGSRIILRPSLQNGLTGSLLAEAVAESDPQESWITIVNCLAKDFIDACCSSRVVDLVHYIGSNQYAHSVFTQAFNAGKICLLDGQGNGLLYLDDTFSPEDAVRIITTGAVRYNGETCTSINGVLIKNTIYEATKERLVDSFRNLHVGHPLEEKTQIGPLFSEKHALAQRKIIQETPKAHVLCGGEVDKAYFTPAVLEGVNLQDPIACEGVFGPLIWLGKVSENSLWDWLKGNRFPLSDTILSTNYDLIQSFAKNSRAARICVNEDPSIESMFEPWGGYPPSGLNPVSVWIEKYKQTFQLDGRLREIMTIPCSIG